MGKLIYSSQLKFTDKNMKADGFTFKIMEWVKNPSNELSEKGCFNSRNYDSVKNYKKGQRAFIAQTHQDFRPGLGGSLISSIRLIYEIDIDILEQMDYFTVIACYETGILDRECCIEIRNKQHGIIKTVNFKNDKQVGDSKSKTVVTDPVTGNITTCHYLNNEKHNPPNDFAEVTVNPHGMRICQKSYLNGQLNIYNPASFFFNNHSIKKWHDNGNIKKLEYHKDGVLIVDKIVPCVKKYNEKEQLIEEIIHKKVQQGGSYWKITTYHRNGTDVIKVVEDQSGWFKTTYTYKNDNLILNVMGKTDSYDPFDGTNC